MNGTRNLAISDRPVEWCKPFVGAMKIARNVAVSDRPVEWGNVQHGTTHRTTQKPQPLRAIFIAPTKTQKIYLSATIEVHSLSFAALSSSLREGAGRACTIHRGTR